LRAAADRVIVGQTEQRDDRIEPMGPVELESVILFVSDLITARAFYVDGLGLPVRYEDEIVVVMGSPGAHVVLHRKDRGHDERGIFPAGEGVGAAAVRFTVEDPDACEREVIARGLRVVWPTQDAPWGRFVVLADPDGRSVVLAKMRPLGGVRR
jgi:catechol 2,3-dioxygenase-like lactoylglutathione lyase family enzyme